MATSRSIETIQQAVMAKMRLQDASSTGRHGDNVYREIIDVLNHWRGKDLGFNEATTTFATDANSKSDRYIHRMIRPKKLWVEDSAGNVYREADWVEYSETYFQINTAPSTDTNTNVQEWSWFKDRIYWWPKLATGITVHLLYVIGPPVYDYHYESGDWVYKSTVAKGSYDTADPTTTTQLTTASFGAETDALWLDKASNLVVNHVAYRLYKGTYKAEDGRGVHAENFRDLYMEEQQRLLGEKANREGPRVAAGHL